MLQHSLKRVAAVSSSALKSDAQCNICACRCGATFGSNGCSVRWSSWRKSPAAWRKIDGLSLRKGSEEGPKKVVQLLKREHERGYFSTGPEQVAGFIKAFHALQPNLRSSTPIDPRKMREIMDAHDLLDKDCWHIPNTLLTVGDKYDRNTAKRMLLSMSRAGVVEATIRIMAHVLLEARRKPEKLKAREIEYAKQHLSRIASEKENFRAMVCEGKVARALGNEKRAIEMWTDAMAAAVEDAEEKERQRLTGFKVVQQFASDPLELSSPWIELMLLHRERSERRGKDEMQQCRWAMEVGCKQDDPISFYHASTFVKQYDAQNNHLPTSEWLYYVTKAAASNHPIAAYELGKFYAESGWKYLEDEPPNHVKPTPFDSFPSPTENSMLQNVLLFFGLAKKPEIKPEESLFHNAIFPHSAKERYMLAFEWLQIAAKYFYAPAFLYRAQLHLEKNLWAQADAPEAAVKMTADRYEYASEEDYKAGKAIQRPEEKAKEDPPNPFYNPTEARKWLREIFFAYEADFYSQAVRKAQAAAARRRRGAAGAEEEDEIQDADLFSKQGANIQKWFLHPEVRDMYEDELAGLYRQAKKICDDHGWDVYDTDNALIYKAGSGKSRSLNVS
ncbi:hypothetical protein CKM354_000819500 [Cercospora kikuchii]|uniref:Uncharacterized protein n=1 Tax=Cercospora kikuchii TaxID=84275 RepID=A0A9P3CLQ2_9PEZI|nr:uncharacterized protein CKM354_000819500 [Cercospora kikuchii]GIZ45011.1 hypothetical protein CKM354_000819500 [Cercospora kikuchii]